MNIKNNIIRISFLLAILLFNFTSCDYLDVVPPEQPGLQDATKTRANALGFLFSCYAGLTEVDSPISHTSPLTGSVDEFVLPVEWQAGGGGTYDDYLYDLVSAADTDGLWDNYYKYIGQCYLFIRQIEEHPGDALLKEWLPGEKEQWLSEARFLIAYYHFALLRKYGPVPIITEYISQDASSSEFGGRCHFDYCVNWIARQLDLAAVNLPPVREGNEWGRATSTIAKAVKARMLLYAASPLWNGEYPYPSWKNKVVTPGDKEFFVDKDAKYKDLIGRDDYGYELISSSRNEAKWERAMEACQEALDLATGEGDCQLYGTGENDMTFYQTELGNDDKYLPYVPGKEDLSVQENRLFRQRVMMFRYLVATRFPNNKEYVWALTGKNINDRVQGRIPANIFLAGNKTTRAGGYSAISPTLFSIEHFYTEKGELPEDAAAEGRFTPKSDWLKRAGVKGNGREDIVNLCVNREPRFYAWFAFDGGDYGSLFYKTKASDKGSPCLLNMKTSEKNGFDRDRNQRNYCVTGFLTQKFVNPNAQYKFDGGGFQAGATKPMPIIRLAELYLNLAECQANVGGVHLIKALSNLKVIRDRAGVETPTEVPQQDELIRMIHNERFVEFWDEGLRYHDVRRWVEGKIYFGAKREGLNAMVKDVSFEDFNVRTNIDQPYKWNDRLYLTPITNPEVYKNPQLVQAPGY